MLKLVRILKGNKGHKKGIYLCRCGNETAAFVDNVNRGHTKSCGCLRKKATAERSRKHGHRTKRSKVYVAWCNMKARCRNKSSRDYANYGGRGIDYDPSWEDFESFLNDMGEPESNMTLDRKDNEKGYSLENCRWVTRKIQNVNKRNNVFYELNGESRTLSEWSRMKGIGRVTMLKRIQNGVPLELALTVRGYLKMPTTDKR